MRVWTVRPRVVVVAAAVAAGACTGGDGGGFVPPSPTSTWVATPTSTSAPPKTTITEPAIPPGAVRLRVSGMGLPDIRAGGTGLRLLLRSASDRLTVHRRGGEGAVLACPVRLPAGPPDDGACVDLAAGAVVEVPSVGGVLLRAGGAPVSVEEMSVTYVAAARTTTVVTPARPAGACEARACEATFSLSPGGTGAFSLDGQGGGGRPRFVLTAVAAGGSFSNRVLATVEGGGPLSIRATLEAGSEARLLHHEQGPGPVPPATAEILWP